MQICHDRLIESNVTHEIYPADRGPWNARFSKEKNGKIGYDTAGAGLFTSGRREKFVTK